MSARATTHPERRVRGLFIGILVVLSVLAAQLVRLQGFDAAGLAKKGAAQRTVDEPIPATRGVITDATGTVLADSVETYTVIADQQAVSEYAKRVDGRRQIVGAKGAAADLAPILKLQQSDLEAKLTGERRYNRVATGVAAVAWRSIAKLGIPGIASERTVRRVYPQGVGTSSVIGVMRNDGVAAGGVERMLDSRLKGTPGSQSYEQTATGQKIPTADGSYVAPVPGTDVRLTLDADVSWFAQNALADAVPKVKALNANVVALDVQTGQVLTAASYPTFDPVDTSTWADGGRLDNAVFDEVFEPGSTAKVITMGAALQEGIVTPGTGVTVPNRLQRVQGDPPFRDSHEHETLQLTATGVLAQSSNIGTILIGEKIPSAKLLSYMSSFGLGHASGIGFPGETSGIVPKSVGDSQRYTIMFGQGLAVNTLQTASVFQTVANGGKRVAPSLVAGTTDSSGKFKPAAAPESHQVISQETASTLTHMMESVVSDEGTARLAEIPGYLVAGKTGTANRYDAAKKAYNGYTASFVGFAPADKPRFVVAVTVQRPLVGESGGVIAAPIFTQVMKYLLEKYNIPPSGASAANLPLTTDGSDPVHGGPSTRSATASASATPSTTGSTSPSTR